MDVLFIGPKQATEILQRKGMFLFIQNYFRSWINDYPPGVLFNTCQVVFTHFAVCSLCVLYRKGPSPVIFRLCHEHPALGLSCCCHTVCNPFENQM